MSYRWKRAPPGGDSGNVRGAGRPAPRAGTWHRRAARSGGQARQLARLTRRGRARPLHLIHGGALSVCPAKASLARTDVTWVAPARAPATPRTGHDRQPARARAEAAAPTRARAGHRGGLARETRVPGGRGLPRGRKGRSPASVQKHVDHLCKTGPSLCTRWGKAGDFAVRPDPSRGFHLLDRNPQPVHRDKSEIVHMPRRDVL
jgi:hypothetical protein